MTGGARSERRGLRIALALLLTVLVGCAYYNTFFLARKSYNAAEESVRRSQQEKVPTDAARNYETAIAQCRKVLERHSKSGYVDDALYLMSASYYGKGDYDSAMVRLDEFFTSQPKSDLMPDAIFLAGMTKTKQHKYDDARAQFNRVVDEYPKFRRRDEIYYALGEAAERKRDKHDAIRLFESLVEEFPKSLRRDDALERIGELYFEAGRYDSSAMAYERILSSVRDETTRIEATVHRAEALVRLGEGQEALDLIRSALPKESTTDDLRTAGRPSGGGMVGGAGDDVARLRLQEAAALNQMNRSQDALNVLSDITGKYPTSSYAVEAQFQIGYTYESLLDSLDAARDAYEKVSKLTGRSVFREQALQRAEALKSIISLEQQASGNAAEEAKAAAALRIAEIMLLDRHLTDDAIAKYGEVESDFPQTRSAPRAGYARAYVQWKYKDDSLGAQTAFRDLVARYPDSPQARSAIDLLNAQGADTSGLRGMLKEMRADTVAVQAPADSSAAGADSAGVGIDSLDDRRRLEERLRREEVPGQEDIPPPGEDQLPPEETPSRPPPEKDIESPPEPPGDHKGRDR